MEKILTIAQNEREAKYWFAAIAALKVKTYTTKEVLATGQPVNYGRYFARCVWDGVFIRETDYFRVNREQHKIKAKEGDTKAGAGVEATREGVVVLPEKSDGTLSGLVVLIGAFVIVGYFLFANIRRG